MLELSNLVIVKSVLNFVAANPGYGLIFTGVVSFLESLAVIGLAMPGAIIMPAIGYLVGANLMPLGSTIMYSAAGALLADCISYWLGFYFKGRVSRVWPFTKYLNLLASSERFFKRYWMLSVFIGKFIGPMRPMIPLIAGVSRMPLIRFFVAIVPAAVGWSIVYLFPGILLGAISLELPPKVATKFVLYAVLGLLVVWMLVWLIRSFSKRVYLAADSLLVKAWNWLDNSGVMASKLVSFLSNSQRTDNHLQLGRIILLGILVLLFWFIAGRVFGGYFAQFNQAIFHLLSSLRGEILDNLMLLVTFFCERWTYCLVITMIFSWLWLRGYHYTLFAYLMIVLVGSGLIFMVRYFSYYPRPDLMVDVKTSSSFPSAHTAAGLFFYGFLLFVIADQTKKANKKLLAGLAIGFSLLMAFSRIYLGAHWFSDVLGGLVGGGVVLLLGIIVYRRRDESFVKGHRFSWFSLAAVLLALTSYTILNFNEKKADHQLIWPEQVINQEELLVGKDFGLPKFRQSRLGVAIEAFNLIYVGPLSAITQILVDHGWQLQDTKFNWQQLLSNIHPDSVSRHLAIFSQLHQGKSAVLVSTKFFNGSDSALVFRLWEANATLKVHPSIATVQTKQLEPNSIWIGTIEQHYLKPSVFSLKRFRKTYDFVGATEVLAKSLNSNFSWRMVSYALEEQPAELRALHWNGKILVIITK